MEDSGSLPSREVWNQRHSAAEILEPSVILKRVESSLVGTGRALDVAGGRGRHAIWLARLGYQVTLVDFSVIALGKAIDRAHEFGVELETIQADLEVEPLPRGPWDAVLCCHYLQRSLWPTIVDELRPGGVFVLIHPTIRNLERSPRPSRRFLLEEGELEQGVPGLETLVMVEGWLEEGRHELVFAGRKVDPAPRRMSFSTGC